jgi:hypothetical protein
VTTTVVPAASRVQASDDASSAASSGVSASRRRKEPSPVSGGRAPSSRSARWTRPRSVSSEASADGASGGEGVEERADERRERGERREEPERERDGKGAGASQRAEEVEEELRRAGRERAAERLEGGEVAQPRAAVEGAAVPAGEPQVVAQQEEEAGDAEGVGLARGGVGARPVVVQVELLRERREPSGGLGGIAGMAEELAEPADQLGGARALEPGAGLAVGEEVAPGRVAVLRGEEDGEHAVEAPGVRRGTHDSAPGADTE